MLKPGEIKLTVRNDGPDAVTLAQVIVNDGFADFSDVAGSLGRLESGEVDRALSVDRGRAPTR